jgi:glycyl-tRNA synthetase (class II)
LPPAIAPLHIVIVPIAKNKEEIEKIKNYLEPLTKLLDNEKLSFYSKYFKNSINISYKIDEDLNH